MSESESLEVDEEADLADLFALLGEGWDAGDMDLSVDGGLEGSYVLETLGAGDLDLLLYRGEPLGGTLDLWLAGECVLDLDFTITFLSGEFDPDLSGESESRESLLSLKLCSGSFRHPFSWSKDSMFLTTVLLCLILSFPPNPPELKYRYN